MSLKSWCYKPALYSTANSLRVILKQSQKLLKLHHVLSAWRHTAHKLLYKLPTNILLNRNMVQSTPRLTHSTTVNRMCFVTISTGPRVSDFPVPPVSVVQLVYSAVLPKAMTRIEGSVEQQATPARHPPGVVRLLPLSCCLVPTQS